MSNLPQKLAEIRASIERTRTEMETVRRIDLPLEETRARVEQVVKSKLADFSRGSGWDGFVSPDPRHGILPIRPPMIEDLLFLVGVECCVERIMEHIEASGRPRGLPMVKRLARIEELRAEIRRLERSEEIEVLALENAGHPVYRRGDADIELLLEIWGERGFRLPAPASRLLRAENGAS